MATPTERLPFVESGYVEAYFRDTESALQFYVRLSQWKRENGAQISRKVFGSRKVVGRRKSRRKKFILARKTQSSHDACMYNLIVVSTETLYALTCVLWAYFDQSD